VIEREQITVLPGVPTVFAMLLSLHEREPIRLPSVRLLTCAGGALLPSFVDGLREMFPNARIVPMYGLTECMRVSYLEPDQIDKRPASCGRPIPGTEAFVLRPDGTPTEPGEIGVLHVRGPHVMPGYFKRPDLTREMLLDAPDSEERVLCTHDYFREDEEGYLYFVGRSDEIIKSRGEKVSPVEVENVLHALRGVREAAVVGVPDELLGEAVRAYVAVEDGYALGEREIVAHCRAALEPFKVPKEVVFVSELPKTPTGKIRKKELDRSPLGQRPAAAGERP
jgi:acyl-coenzyme A synthetase/AMP-(fatty) acid ligase